jgi:hypothetical protein
MGPINQLLLCSACDGVSFAVIGYHDAFVEESTTEILYPLLRKTPVGLAPAVAKAYEAALKVRNIDAKAFGVLLRRVLELVCADRGANGRYLNKQLDDLAERGEVPKQLAEMAHRLRTFGNIGAHAAIGELRDEEIPVLEKLCEAFLQYVYYGPHLLEEADQRLKALKARSMGQYRQTTVHDEVSGVLRHRLHLIDLIIAGRPEWKWGDSRFKTLAKSSYLLMIYTYQCGG